ncbi:unnamed protein product, partial [Rotaria magnacalcarata]
SNEIGNEGVQLLASALKQTMSLQTLDLGINNIGDEGAKCLTDLLKNQTKLQILDLRSNRITDRGAEFLANALNQNTTLKRLSLWQNEITDHGAQRLMNILRYYHQPIMLNMYENRLERTNIVRREQMHHLIRNRELFEESNFVGLSISRRTTSRMFADRLQIQNTQSMNEEDFWLGLYGTNELFSRRPD